MKIGKRREEKKTRRDLNDPRFVQELVDNYIPDPNDQGMVVFHTLQRNAERAIAQLKAKPYSKQRMKWLKQHEDVLAELKKAQAEWIRAAAALAYLEKLNPSNPIFRELKS
ncbi:MAG: hypothetical protein OXT69_00500 [Candidatus Poribacteria bacterium]|nr:hypothetical protein [Candidatus Poribacteria bacterium]